jgi:hypothetical protein
LLATDLVEPAGVQTFEQLGDGRRALALAVRHECRPPNALESRIPRRETHEIVS